MIIEEIYQTIWDTTLDYCGEYYKAVEQVRLFDITGVEVTNGNIYISSRQIGQLIGYKGKLHDKLQKNLELPLKLQEDVSRTIADGIIKYGCPPDTWD